MWSNYLILKPALADYTEITNGQTDNVLILLETYALTRLDFGAKSFQSYYSPRCIYF